MPNLGKFAVQAIKEWNPFGAEAITRREENKAFRKAHRKQKRQERRMADKVTVTMPDGSTFERAEPTIPARTSTKLGVAGGVGVYPVINMLQDMVLPWPWLEEVTNSNDFAILASIAIAWLIARFTKSPIAKRAL